MWSQKNKKKKEINSYGCKWNEKQLISGEPFQIARQAHVTNIRIFGHILFVSLQPWTEKGEASETDNYNETWSNYVIMFPLCRHLTLNDIRSPPLSATFSPWVLNPFTFRPVIMSLYWLYWLMKHFAFVLYFFSVLLVHQSRRLPYSSYCLPVRQWKRERSMKWTESAGKSERLRWEILIGDWPSSSNAWMISWPIVFPIAPKFSAAGPPKLKNGACKMPAGNSLLERESVEIKWRIRN